MTRMIRTYTELIKIRSFEERFRYLKLDGVVGQATFGYDRYLNQLLYASDRWKKIRRDIIIRDNGCDLGIKNNEIAGRIFVHHMNPIPADEFDINNDDYYNPEYLISSSKLTHDAIHYGDEKLLIKAPTERRPNDTCPWR